MRARRLILAACFFGAAALHASAPLSISDSQALAAGKRLWKNECAGTVEGLTSWNAGEDFASLGIGHYIWYPAGRRGPFEESFPDLVRFLGEAGQKVPGWLRGPCPWDSRAAFVASSRNAQMSELRGLLANTVALQARFSANRLEAALPKMIDAAPAGERDAVRRSFYAVAAAPDGVYALVDYVNFKGEGVLATERYKGEGWGLSQVLAGMREEGSGSPSRAFSESAARVLSRRVANSPPARGESRWLAGWKARVRTYAANG